MAYIILFSNILSYNFQGIEKYFWAILIIDILTTTYLLKQNKNINPMEHKLNSILKKNEANKNMYRPMPDRPVLNRPADKNVHFDIDGDNDTSIESGESDFDLTEFEKSL